MARPRADASSAPTQDRLLQAGEAAFAVRGFADTRLEDVAKECGITRPSLLYHFATKEELYAAVVHRAFERLATALLAAMSIGGSFVERVDAVSHGFLAFVRGNPHFAPLLLRELLDGRGPGRQLILDAVTPVIDALERFLVEDGGEVVRPGLPARAAILQLAMGTLVRAASGPLEKPLWGEGEDLPTMARIVFLREAP